MDRWSGGGGVRDRKLSALHSTSDDHRASVLKTKETKKNA